MENNGYVPGNILMNTDIPQTGSWPLIHSPEGISWSLPTCLLIKPAECWGKENELTVVPVFIVL